MGIQRMIVFDTETTGLVMPELADITAQPKIIEFAAVKMELEFVSPMSNDPRQEWRIKDTLAFFVDPLCDIDPKVTKLTGISNALLKAEGATPFTSHVESIQEFFLGERQVWAHNLAFDLSVLKFELSRIGYEYKFPWPLEQRCTVEVTSHWGLKDRKFTTLYEHVTKQKLQQTHRAMDDVLALCTVIQKMYEDSTI